MNTKKESIPKRRFKEFENSEAWEQRKVEGYATFLKGNGLSWSNITSDGKQECILYGNLYTDYGMITEEVVYKTNAQLKNGVYSRFGDVLIPASDTTPTGLARATSIERTGVLLGGDINVIRPNDNINGSCMSLALNAKRRELIKLIKGTTVKHIYNSDVRNIYMSLPKSNDEQVKIVSLFKNLDNLITLHQRKLEKLNNLKSAYLSDMFPKEWEKYPKLRFEGFTEPWEQRKLGELGSVAMNKRIFKDQTSEIGDVPFYKIGTFGRKPDAYISRDLFEEYKAKYPYPEVGDILISASGSIGRTVEYTGKDEYFQDSNIVWLKHDNRLNNLFLKQFYMIVEWEGLEGSTIKRLYNKNILETQIFLPSFAEQQRIGMFFKDLDNLIILHQRKLEKLQDLKKAYLNEMFI